MKRLKLFAVIWVLFAVAACGPGYRVHAGAKDSLDSKAYDSLLVAQGALNEARDQIQAGKLPGALLPRFNDAVKAYNVARLAWQAYHAGTGNAKLLENDLNALTTYIATFQTKAGRQP